MRKLSVLISVLAFALLASSAFAGSGFTSLSTALGSLCSGIRSLIPIVAFLMIVAAGVIYAAGQLLGAETRARASVWAT
ncbi:MAG: TrbC/VirB2 family protein, partial [Candidatus Micrarchaeia archaeon]